jgi:hypothetical protein
MIIAVKMPKLDLEKQVVLPKELQLLNFNTLVEINQVKRIVEDNIKNQQWPRKLNYVDVQFCVLLF